ncbi:MAG: creatininase family protein [Burkholderiales bacterium]|nr:creatininase family protein [Burkholderiales bacterium]
MPLRPFLRTLVLLAAAACPPVGWAAAPEVQLDALTTTEVRDALRAGTTTILIPIGGTEQNGAHMALGKHNYRAAFLSERIALKLGKTLVAPVVAYVPEPAGHMRHAGTVSVPDAAFSAMVAAVAGSLRQHGFKDIVLLGDSGDYQPLLRQLAARLTRDWAASGVRVHHADAYYRAATTGFRELLRERGHAGSEVAAHAGLADTSLMMAIDPSRVRAGAPSGSSAALGQLGVDLVIETTVAAIREAAAARR